MEYHQTSLEDLEAMIQNGSLQKIIARKAALVKARVLGQEDIDCLLASGGYRTVVVDDSGIPRIECVNTNIHVTDVLVTNCIAGCENSYILASSRFHTRYLATEEPHTYKPVGQAQIMYRVPSEMNLRFEASWGSEFKLRGGGVIVPEDDQSGYYGINPEEFKATYSIVEFGNSESPK